MIPLDLKYVYCAKERGCIINAKRKAGYLLNIYTPNGKANSNIYIGGNGYEESYKAGYTGCGL